MAETKQLIDTANHVLLGNYRRQPVMFVRGEGATLWDADGKEYLDMLAGIATCSLGHCHPKLVEALKVQSEKLWHVSNIFYSEPSIALGARLTRISGLQRAFFCNSGAEANEALIKLARKVQHDRGTGRYEIICANNSFHGRTLAAVTATGQPKYHKGFEPLPAGFVHVPYGDLEAIEKAITDKTAAILMEPVQGEGGVRVAPKGFLEGIRALCDKHGLLMLLDEVQTGVGRTGTFFAFQQARIKPDAVSMAKALGNGIPIGAMLCTEDAGKSLSPGTHASTFGGNLLACAVANVAVDIIEEPSLLENCRRMGERLVEKLEKLRAEKPQLIKEIRGKGLLIGVELTRDASPVVGKCRDEGLIVNLAGEQVVRFVPPLNVSAEQIDSAVERFARALAALPAA